MVHAILIIFNLQTILILHKKHIMLQNYQIKEKVCTIYLDKQFIRNIGKKFFKEHNMKMRMDKHNFMLKVLILIERFKVLKLIYSVSFNHSHDSNSQKQIMNFLYLHGKIFKLLKIFLKAGKFFKHPHHFIQYQYIHKKEDHPNVILEIFY